LQNLSGGVVGVGEGAVIDQVAGGVVTVSDGLGAALALQSVAAGIDMVGFRDAVVQYLTRTVAVKIVSIVELV